MKSLMKSVMNTPGRIGLTLLCGLALVGTAQMNAEGGIFRSRCYRQGPGFFGRYSNGSYAGYGSQNSWSGYRYSTNYAPAYGTEYTSGSGYGYYPTAPVYGPAPQYHYGAYPVWEPDEVFSDGETRSSYSP